MDTLFKGYNFLQLFIASVLGGVVVKALDAVGENWVGEWFEKRKASRLTKQQWADEIIKIFTEGASRGWNVTPRNQEHILWVSNQIEGIDKEVASELRQCMGYWTINAFNIEEKRESGSITSADIAFSQKLQKDAGTLGERLLKKAHQWKNA